jgi:hypothetical protein
MIQAASHVTVLGYSKRQSYKQGDSHPNIREIVKPKLISVMA